MASQPIRYPTAVASELGPSVRACDRLSGGRNADTYLLTLDDQPYRAVCKVGGPSIRTGDVIEPLVMDRVDETTELPVPSVFASGTLPTDSTRWALYEFRPGFQPTPYKELDPEVRHRIVTDIGTMLGRLHSTHQYETTGRFAREDGDLELRESGRLNVAGIGRGFAKRLPSSPKDECQPVLAHGDLFPGNLLIDETGRITGLLDWGDSHVTTAGYDLARAEMRFIDWFRLPGPERRLLRSELRSSYRQFRELPPDYPNLTSFYKTIWLTQSAKRVIGHLKSRRGRKQLKRHVHSIIR